MDEGNGWGELMREIDIGNYGGCMSGGTSEERERGRRIL